jgi:hypothetical protein
MKTCLLCQHQIRHNNLKKNQCSQQGSYNPAPSCTIAVGTRDTCLSDKITKTTDQGGEVSDNQKGGACLSIRTEHDTTPAEKIDKKEIKGAIE